MYLSPEEVETTIFLKSIYVKRVGTKYLPYYTDFRAYLCNNRTQTSMLVNQWMIFPFQASSRICDSVTVSQTRICKNYVFSNRLFE